MEGLLIILWASPLIAALLVYPLFALVERRFCWDTYMTILLVCLLWPALLACSLFILIGYLVYLGLRKEYENE